MSADHVRGDSRAEPDGGAGLFAPDSLMWQLFGEQVLTLFAGGRALLLQVAHPLVAAGVEQHSNYRQDPWGRLVRTLDILLSIVFGDLPTARATAQRLERRHHPVHGIDPRGRPYRALDPELMLWVHATLIDTSRVTYERYVRPLSPGERTRFHQESIVLGEAFGIPRELHPPTVRAFDAYMQRVLDEELERTDTLLGVARTVFSPPLPEVLDRLVPAPVWKLALLPVAETLRIATVGNSPRQLRELLGMSLRGHEQLALRAQQQLARRVVPRMPAAVRLSPYARAARRRCTAGGDRPPPVLAA